MLRLISPPVGWNQVTVVGGVRLVFVLMPVKELAGLGCAYHEFSYTMCYVTLVDTLVSDGSILVCNAVIFSLLCDEVMMISLCLCSSVYACVLPKVQRCGKGPCSYRVYVKLAFQRCNDRNI